MKKQSNLTKKLSLIIVLFVLTFVFQNCQQKENEKPKNIEKIIIETEKPEYF